MITDALFIKMSHYFYINDALKFRLLNSIVGLNCKNPKVRMQIKI